MLSRPPAAARPTFGFTPVPARARPVPPLRLVIGSVLRSEREEQHRTLRDVADDAGVSMAYLSEVERGRKEASSEILAAICTALDLRLVDLLGRVHWLLLADDAGRPGAHRPERTAVSLADPRGVGGHGSALALVG